MKHPQSSLLPIIWNYYYNSSSHQSEQVKFLHWLDNVELLQCSQLHEAHVVYQSYGNFWQRTKSAGESGQDPAVLEITSYHVDLGRYIVASGSTSLTLTQMRSSVYKLSMLVIMWTCIMVIHYIHGYMSWSLATSHWKAGRRSWCLISSTIGSCPCSIKWLDWSAVLSIPPNLVEAVSQQVDPPLASNEQQCSTCLSCMELSL